MFKPKIDNQNPEKTRKTVQVLRFQQFFRVFLKPLNQLEVNL
jgi:hypothetical protein